MLTLQQAVKERIELATIENEQAEAEKAIQELEREIRMCHVNVLLAQWLQEKTAVVIHPFKLEITVPEADQNNLDRCRYWISYRISDEIILRLTVPAFLKKNEEGRWTLSFRDPNTWHDNAPAWRALVMDKYNRAFPDFITAAAWAMDTYEEHQAKANVKAEAIVIPPAEPLPF